jgi:diketogulonate reductase-like aldo/keto reductase
MLARAVAQAPVFCDQVEYHVQLSQRRVLDVAAEHELLVAAYRPLGGGRGVLDDPLLAEIARAHGRTPAQVALRWLVEQDRVCALPRSADPERRAENLDVFSFELSDSERRRSTRWPRASGAMSTCRGRRIGATDARRRGRPSPLPPPWRAGSPTSTAQAAPRSRTW